jgi:peptidoglycan/LPS O-acetylase OafA/YrhL
MTAKRLQMIAWIVIIGCILLGGLLGIYLIGKDTGVYDYDLILPICVGTFGGFLIFLALSKLKQKRNVPDFDERSMKVMQKYFLIAFYVILVGSGAALVIVYAMGIKTIETGLLIVCLGGLYMILGFGALIAKRL